jgi:hypothetical protein
MVLPCARWPTAIARLQLALTRTKDPNAIQQMFYTC